MPDKAAWLIESNIAGVVKLLIEERGLSMPEALRALFRSRLYDAIVDRETGLYLESSAYLHELFKQMEAIEQR